MKNEMIKADLNYDRLEELGYVYSMMEGGYISEDGATIISIDRRPYERQVMQYKANVEDQHIKNVDKLKEADLLE